MASTKTIKTAAKFAKADIPRALREQVWIVHTGRSFEAKCLVPWCQNMMTVFDFHVGHNVPESRGGATELANLRPICARCNLSMGAQYSIEEWGRLSAPVVTSVSVPVVPVVPIPVIGRTWWCICC